MGCTENTAHCRHDDATQCIEIRWAAVFDAMQLSADKDNAEENIMVDNANECDTQYKSLGQLLAGGLHTQTAPRNPAVSYPDQSTTSHLYLCHYYTLHCYIVTLYTVTLLHFILLHLC